MQNTNWDSIYNLRYPSEAFDLSDAKVDKALNTLVPTKIFMSSTYPVWYNCNIRNCIKIKNKKKLGVNTKDLALLMI